MDDELLSVPVPLGGAEPPSALHHHDHDDDLSKKLPGEHDKQHDDPHEHEHHVNSHEHDVDESDGTGLNDTGADGNDADGGDVDGGEDPNDDEEHGARSRSRGNSGSGGSGNGGNGNGRSRVNDKGEPAMMLPSFIWDYFIKENSGKFVVCTLCPDQSTRFAYSGGTSTMNRHLRKKHQKYAPGKCAADYEYAKSGGKSRSSPHSSVSSGLASDAATSLGNLSPNEAGRRHLIDMRNSRRRASTKRRKLLHPSLMDADHSAVVTAAAVHATADFDPSAFVNLQGHNASSSPGTGLQFPQGFELSDGAMDMGGDQRFFDYTTLTGGAPGAAGTPGTMALSSGFRHRRGSSNGPNQKVLTHRLLKYLIAQYEPLDVSRMGMELNVLLYGTDYPSTKLPAEETLKLALANLYYSQREILKEVIAEVEMLSLSLNNWKSVFGQNVLTVSGHWISNGFSRRDCVLEVYVLPLDESVNTIALLRDVMDKWDIPSGKVAALTMIKNGKEEAIHEEYPGLSVVNCFVNVLDSAVTAGLLKCAPLIRRCRNYVSYFIQNPSEYQIFLSLQRKVAEANVGIGLHDGVGVNGSDVDPTGSGSTIGEDDPEAVKAGGSVNGGGGSSPKLSGASGPGLGSGVSVPMPAPALSVICDFEDRWNSTSEMICRIVELEQMLLLYKNGLESDTNPNRRPMQLRFVCCELSTDEWANLKELARLLEPIEGVVHVSNLEYPGLSIIYPLLHSIKKHLDDAELWISTSFVSAVRNAIASGLNMQLCTSGAAPSSPYLSSLLDPRFKSLPFVDADERERIVEMLKLLHGELIGDKDKDDHLHHHHHHDGHHKKPKPQSVTPAPLNGVQHHSVKKTGLLHEFFPLDEPTTELDKLKAQVQQYLESPSLPATDESENDPLEWWSRYQRMFPYLAKLARKYLCISAVSLPFYEAFTNYGQLMKEKKARLDIEVAAQILFCRSLLRTAASEPNVAGFEEVHACAAQVLAHEKLRAVRSPPSVHAPATQPRPRQQTINHEEALNQQFIHNREALLNVNMATHEETIADSRRGIYLDDATYQKAHFLIPNHYQDDVDSVLIPTGLIQDRVEKIAQDIRYDYEGKTVHLLCVLKGGSAFFHDLIEKLRLFHKYNKCDYVPFTFDFIKVKSYEGTKSTGNVQISGADLTKFKGKELLLVEDIIDTGKTMSKLVPLLQQYEPASVKVASLLEKRNPESCGFKADYAGFSIPDKFVVGYCLDYNEIFRDLDHICIISEHGIAKYASHS